MELKFDIKINYTLGYIFPISVRKGTHVMLLRDNTIWIDCERQSETEVEAGRMPVSVMGRKGCGGDVKSC